MKILVESVAGSRLYGTHRPDSDTDVRGVCFAPVESLLGLAAPFEQLIEMEPVDRTIWELRKFIGLALKNNPNILDVLFCPPDKWIDWTPDWTFIYAQRKSVLSQQVRATYAGYANSQLQRIDGHRRWLIDPPEKPDVRDYGEYRSGSTTFQWFSDEQLAIYKDQLKDWTNYQAWLAGRNPARHSLEVKYGYDVKHASHLMRLLIQARTILETGDFSPVLERHQLGLVKQVLNGEWPYEHLMEQAKWFFDVVKNVASPLPLKPDSTEMAETVLWIYKKYVRST